jgi:ubiquinone/menaquinone biosynthesis C-methylase UbiE
MGMGLSDDQYRKVMRKGWNLTPEIYDRVWRPVLREYSVGCLERANVGPGDRVLDVATGPGTAALLAADCVGATGSVLGVDISDRFVEVATATATGKSNARFERREMERLDLAPRSFDVATCVLGLMYAAPVSAAIGEMARVLAPGGRFAACVWGRRDRCCFREVFPILGRRLQMDVCPLFFALGAPGAFASALADAGFDEPHEEHVEVVLRWADDAEACAAIFDGGPGALPFSMFPDDVRCAVRDEYLATLEPYRRGAGFEAPAEFVYAAARLPK